MKKLIKLSFDLKQTVGMIHFQGQENGATIRATDLKPKLDRFLARYIAADRKLNWATDSCVQEEEENMLYLQHCLEISSAKFPSSSLTSSASHITRRTQFS